MTAYSLLGQAGTPDHLDTATESQVLGVKFTVSEAVTLTGIWFYSASGAQQLPAQAGLFNSGNAQVFTDAAPSWSGAAGSGWVKYACSQALAAGTYTAAAWNGRTAGKTWYSITAGAWGPVTSGPLACAASPDSYADSAASWQYPGTAFTGYNIWLDAEVSDAAAPVTGSGTAAASLSASAAGASGRSGSGGAPLALGVTAPGSAGRAGSGGTSAGLSATAAGSAARAGTGSIPLGLTASARGISVRAGTGTAPLALSVTAAGNRPASGDALAHLGLSALAPGSAHRPGAGAPALALSARAPGGSRRSGTGTALLSMAARGGASRPPLDGIRLGGMISGAGHGGTITAAAYGGSIAIATDGGSIT